MDETDKQVLEEYHQDVQWIRDHIARDDVYDFATQSLQMAMQLLCKLLPYINLEDEMEQDAEFCMMVRNIAGLAHMKKTGSTENISVGIKIVGLE
jgi:hypothetical protein